VGGCAGFALGAAINAVRPQPAGGNFGVYTETALHKTSGEFGLGVQGNFFIWENTLVAAPQSPFEGSQNISLQSAPGLTWFGAAFTPNQKYNLGAFSLPSGKLRFSMKTSSSASFMVGMKSGNIDGVGQKWLAFQPGSDPYGFVRDGQWHTVEIPMSDMLPEVDLSQVSQFFEILGDAGPVSTIQFDDIYFAGGGALHTNLVAAEVLPGVRLSWPTLSGSNYTVQCAVQLGATTVWTNLAGPAPGDGTTNTLFEPFGTTPQQFYRIRQSP